VGEVGTAELLDLAVAGDGHSPEGAAHSRIPLAEGRRFAYQGVMRTSVRALALPLLLLTGYGATAEPKQVLIVHSFGNAAPPFTTCSTAFETELTERMGEPVDLDEVSLDVARYTTLEMEGRWSN
jgi:hypothetical protein